LRSELVFSAVDRVQNRFLLMHIIRLRTRMRMQASKETVATINHELEGCMLADAVMLPVVKELPPAAPLLFNTITGV